MALRLCYVASVVPLLPDILAPLIRRHIDFKLRDSFRIVVPNGEARQDLEALFLNAEELGGVLIGKSLLTLPAFAQEILLRHPKPSPLASPPLESKCLQIALRSSQPQWNLDAAQLRRCLRELKDIDRVRDLRLRKNGPGLKLLGDFEQILAERGRAWTPGRTFREAWRILSRRPDSQLSEVEEIYFLGFRGCDQVLIEAVEALLLGHPKMNVSLYLPPPSWFSDPEGRLEPWRLRIEALAGNNIEEVHLAAAPWELLPFPTPAHESCQALAVWDQGSETLRLLAPAAAPVAALLDSQLVPLLSRRLLASGVDSGSSQTAALLFAKLESGHDLQASVGFDQIIEAWQPAFKDLQASLARLLDLDSLRLLEAYRQRLREWSQAELLEPRVRTWQEWIHDLQEDFLELRLAAGPDAMKRSPLRRLGREGLAPVERLWIAGLNEGVYPGKNLSRFFDEENGAFLRLQEERIALQQALYLPRRGAWLSYSQFSNAGRSTAPSPLLAELGTGGIRETQEALSLPLLPTHPYLAENARREAERHRGAAGLDSGDLSSLNLQARILERLDGHPLSATYLDDYAKCPWRFFAKWHLRLKEEPEEDLEMAPLRRGKLLHRLLEQTFNALNTAFFAQSRLPNLEQMTGHFEEIFARLSQEVLNLDLPVPTVLRRDQLNRLRQSVQGLLAEEDQALREAPRRLLPRHQEWSFGKPGQAPLQVAVNEEISVPLTGSVDRIDLSEDSGHFLLIDYKSSSAKDKATSIRAGRGLQLFIYLRAVQQLLYPQARPLGGLYWDLKNLKKDQGMARRHAYQEFSHRKLHAQSKSFLKEEAFAELETTLENALREILRNILKGDYSLKPAECMGSFCEFREICRYDDKPRR